MSLARAVPQEFERGKITNVHQGDCQISRDPGVTLSTVLGSCIAACIRDQAAGIGGMNHFLLAEQSGTARDRFGASARYGAFAMEQLINMVLSKGSGDKSNLEIKVFGGGNINSALTDVGANNARFVREFLRSEGYRIAGEDMGGNFARRVMFKPGSGRLIVKRLDATAGQSVAKEEIVFAGRQSTQVPDDDIELF
jgi:chemotaxis protein CheD